MKTAKDNYYKLFPKHSFAIVRFQTETLTIEEAERINFEYKINPVYPKIQKLLVIIEDDCKPLFTIKDLENLSHMYNTELQANNHTIIVWLVAAPLITAFAHVFVTQTTDNSEYCSTIERAYDLLKLSIEYDEFKRLIIS